MEVWCRLDRMAAMRHPDEAERWPDRMATVRHPGVKYPEKMECRPNRMTAEVSG